MPSSIAKTYLTKSTKIVVRLKMNNKFSACVFCGSSNGSNKIYSRAAEELGTLLANNNVDIVYGGSNTGLMGTLANSALAVGGNVTGVIPNFLQESEVGHPNLTELIITDNMHDRKRLMYERADIFISLPGGTGTFDETIETMTWVQLNIFNKEIILVDIGAYWEPFLTLVKHGIKEGFINKKNESLLTLVKSSQQAIDVINRVQQQKV